MYLLASELKIALFHQTFISPDVYLNPSPSPTGSVHIATPTPAPTATPTTKTTVLPPCIGGWSMWINRNTPIGTTGDHEQMRPIEKFAFCPGGELDHVECRDVVTHDDWVSLSEATCTPEDGLQCVNLPFEGAQPCRNYEIRYHCDCSKRKSVCQDL